MAFDQNTESQDTHVSNQERLYFTYILASRKHGTLYIGVTNNIRRRIFEHKEGLAEGFTKRYGVKRLVHVESFPTVRQAIQREKSLKRWPRAWKIRLIEKQNSDWRDLFEDVNR